jgi:hypothetical protein
MANDPQSPKKSTGGPPPVPPGYDERSKKPATQSVATPPVVTAPPVVAEPITPPPASTAPRVKISLSQFYKKPLPSDESTTQTIIEESESTQTAAAAEMAANPLLASVAAVKPSFEEETEDELRVLPVEGKSAERIYSESILADIKVTVSKKVIEQEKARIRNNARASAGEGLLQFSTMQMFAGVMVGAVGIFMTRFVMTNIIIQGISFVLLMGCVVCFAMLQKSNDERVWLVAQPLFLLYIASLLIGIAMN